jgi:alcohol dehydrogenase YqhD (iron-dependent ADH family)
MKKFTDYNLHMYTDIVFGKDTAKQAASKVKQHSGTKVMLVYGEGSIKRSGLYDIVTGSLKQEGVPFVEFGGVKPNPLRSFAMKGLEKARRENVDFLLGVGGGSAIDTAKAIALGLVYDGDIWDFYSGNAAPRKMQKVGTINTISAAGSETSGSSVLVDDITGTFKKAIMFPNVVRPVFAIMDPCLTFTVSKHQTAAGAADIFSHTFERYFTDSSSYLADQFAAGLLRSVIKYTPVAIERPDDYEARAELMLAATFSHNDITSVGRRNCGFTAHGLEAYISGHYDTAHGAGLAMVMPAWLKFIADNGGESKQARAAQFAVDVFGVQPDMGDLRSVAIEGVNRFRAWNRSIGMPLSLKDMGIPESDIPEIVKNTRSNAQGVMTGYMDLDKKDVEMIFRSLV